MVELSHDAGLSPAVIRRSLRLRRQIDDVVVCETRHLGHLLCYDASGARQDQDRSRHLAISSEMREEGSKSKGKSKKKRSSGSSDGSKYRVIVVHSGIKCSVTMVVGWSGSGHGTLGAGACTGEAATPIGTGGMSPGPPRRPQ